MSKRKRPSPTKGAGSRLINHPRPLNERERNLIFRFSYCQVGMTPQQFYTKWEVTYQEIAVICSCSITTVQRWFQRGRNSRHPHPRDLRQLALMDFILEHCEEIPKAFLDLLCPPN